MGDHQCPASAVRSLNCGISTQPKCTSVSSNVRAGCFETVRPSLDANLMERLLPRRRRCTKAYKHGPSIVNCTRKEEKLKVDGNVSGALAEEHKVGRQEWTR